MGKRVAIIGAGASGLAAIKCCLDEGHEPVCFEKADDIGGLWYYRENRDDQGCVFESTVINTSKEIMCFSDFPIPTEYPNFMHNRMVLKYYHLYCDHFKLRQYIRFHTRVDSVAFADDYQSTGRWSVTTTPLASGKAQTETFDAVFVCTGHHCTPNVPEFEGLSDFKGRVLHTHDYLTPAGFENKRILIIGVGNSGCDAAVELGRRAEKLYLSTRRGMWIIHRLADKGLPLSHTRILDMLPDSIKEKGFRRALEQRVDHRFLGVMPDHSPVAQHPTVNDFLPNCIMNGSVIMKPDIRRFTAKGVEFKDGTMADLDVVILGTGYVFKFPFLDESVVKVERNQLPLYKYVFPTDLPHPSLAFLGYIQPIGAINPISEIQARWATRVINGLATLPSPAQMKAHVVATREAMAKRYVASPRHTIQVDFIPYMDSIAVEFGVRPDFWKMLLWDPVLAYRCVFRAYTPYQYRLVGPGQWAGARDAIMTLWDRVQKPLQTRKVTASQDQGSNLFVWLITGLVILLAIYWLLG